MNKEDLKVGERYWYACTKTHRAVPLTFMQKVDGRKAFRFSPLHGKQVYILHERRLDNVFLTHREVIERLIRRLQNMATGLQRGLDTEGQPLLAPRLDQWRVAQGFPRRVRIGR